MDSKDFIEDHNTATMPSMKYYNLAAWEREQREKAVRKAQKARQKYEAELFILDWLTILTFISSYRKKSSESEETPAKFDDEMAIW